MEVTLRHTRTFLAVVRLGSLTRAAEFLCPSRPTLTVQIRQLEEALGLRLLDRLPRGAGPTPAGRQLALSLERLAAEFDAVLAYGEAYTSTKRFEDGRVAGKRAMLSVTVSTRRKTYARDGRSGDIDLLLWPSNFSLAYAGYTRRPSRRGSRASKAFRAALPRAGERATIPFNRKAEWGPDGRIAPGAPVHSPFIRRRERLELE